MLKRNSQMNNSDELSNNSSAWGAGAEGSSSLETDSDFGIAKEEAGGDDVERTIFHKGRVESFGDNWPFQHPSKCNPENLALAGFHKVSDWRALAKCFVCQKETGDLTEDIDPWKLHKKINKNCQVIKLGKLTRGDRYRMSDFLDLLKNRNLNILQNTKKDIDKEIKNSVKLLNQHGMNHENGQNQTPWS